MSTVGNIIVHPARVWYAPVGTTEPDNSTVAYGETWPSPWVYAGYTTAPLAMIPRDDVLELHSDGFLIPSQVHRTRAGLALRSVFAEHKNALLGVVWGGSDVLLNEFTTRRTVGFEVSPTIYKWGFESQFEDDNGILRPLRYFFHRGWARWSDEIPFGQSVVAGLPIEINLLIDDSQPAGEELGRSEVPTEEVPPPPGAPVSGIIVASAAQNIQNLTQGGLNIVDGRRVFIHFYQNSATETVTPPAGFVGIAGTVNGTHNVRIYTKIASSEPSSYTMTGSAVTQKRMMISTWSADSTINLDAVIMTEIANGVGQYNWPAKTPVNQPGTVFRFGWMGGGTNHQFTAPSGQTERYDNFSAYGTLYLMTEPYIGVGTLLPKTVSLDSGTPGVSIMHTINVTHS